MDSLHNIKYFLKHQELERQDTDESCYLEIKESKIKGTGSGLFTTKFIPKNSFITYYSPTYIFTGKQIYTDNKIITDQEEVYEIYNKNIDYSMKYYNTRIISLPNYRNNKYLGHLLNDKGYKFGKIYKPQLNNCRHDENGLSTISTRDIKEGEELYASYGKQYWYNNCPFSGKSRNQIIKENLK